MIFILFFFLLSLLICNANLWLIFWGILCYYSVSLWFSPPLIWYCLLPFASISNANFQNIFGSWYYGGITLFLFFCYFVFVMLLYILFWINFFTLNRNFYYFLFLFLRYNLYLHFYRNKEARTGIILKHWLLYDHRR